MSPGGSATVAAMPSQSANVPSVQMGEMGAGGGSGAVHASHGDEGGDGRLSRERRRDQHRSTGRPLLSIDDDSVIRTPVKWPVRARTRQP